MFKPYPIEEAHLNDAYKTSVFGEIILHVAWVGDANSKIRVACVDFIKHHGGHESIVDRINESVNVIVVHPLKSNVEQYKDHVRGQNGKVKKLVVTPAFLLWCAHHGKFEPDHADALDYIFTGFSSCLSRRVSTPSPYAGTECVHVLQLHALLLHVCTAYLLLLQFFTCCHCSSSC